MDFKKLSDKDVVKFINLKISDFEKKKISMQLSIDYYHYRQDILNKKRFTIGKNGEVMEISNLPNGRLLDNQYKRAVDQKVNYLFSKAPVIKCEDEEYQSLIQDLYDKRFLRTLNKVALEAYLCGISWLYVSNNNGKLDFTKLDSTEVIPVWADNNHESLDAIIRCYSTSDMVDGELITVNKVAFYTKDEVKIFKREKDGVDLVLISEEGYLSDEDGVFYSFDKIPFVYFKSSASEEPLLNRVKSLQDAINSIISNFYDNMLEDPRNSIIILKNYDGENLGEFRQKLALYGAVKVGTGPDGADGDVDTLEVNVNAENYTSILKLLKEKLVENIMGLDCKSDKSSQAPNELNIKTMYSDLELDANATELEFIASLEHLEYFFKAVHGISDSDLFSEVHFKRNLMVNDESTVTMIQQSEGLVSLKTLLSKHPFVDDVEEELAQLKAENKDDVGDYSLSDLDENELLE